VVEVDTALLAEVLPLLPPRTRDALADPAVRLTHADPRTALAGMAEAGERFDLLVVAMPEPDSAQANRVYTREFFAACNLRLGDAGVLALRLRGSENLLTPALARRTASIRRALAAVFPSVLALPGTTTVLLASRTPLSLDPERLASRLADRGVAPRLVTPPYLRYLVTNDRRESLERELATNRAPENRDGRPICYSYTLLLWLARFDPALAWLEWPAGAGAKASAAPLLAFAVLGLFAAGAIFWTRRRDRRRRMLLAAAAGALGMLLEGVLILAYQVRHGVLYQDLGLLLTAFMAGLAVGAAGVARARRRRGRVAGWGLIAGLVVTSLLAGQKFSLPIWTGLPLALLLLAAAGAGTGGLFACASGGSEAVAGEIGSLYAADLGGGACGALAGTLVLVPLFGLATTGLLLAAAALALGPLLAGSEG
jgi:spermidine synthase